MTATNTNSRAGFPLKSISQSLVSLISNVERTTDNIEQLMGSLNDLPITEVSRVVNAETAIQPVADFLAKSALFTGAMKSFHILTTLVADEDDDYDRPFMPDL